ncbi:uracil-DNA glycosylase-like protein [Tirmania nivea]|nr:uracil-DNA glycosylase-like protein [Tirmania nivea]
MYWMMCLTRHSMLALACQGHVSPSCVCAVAGLKYLLPRLPQTPSSSFTPRVLPPGHSVISSSLRKSFLFIITMAAKRKAPATIEDTPKKARAITSFFVAKDGSGGKSADEPVSNFDKNAWAKTLTDEQRRLLKLELETMHVSWLGALKEVLVTEQFLRLKQFLEEEKKAGKTIYPVEQDIYSWSRYCPLNMVKVVILGQDPYHGPNQAHGLSFSVRPPTPAPPSLINIYTCLKNDYPNFKPPPNRGGLLVPWAEQGVLLLNASLTVRKSEASSHANKGWEMLTGKAIEVITQKRTRGVVFMAWGNQAQLRCKAVDKKKHKVLESAHPSPLSAHRGFFGCGHFRKANDFLQERYGVEGIIDWNLGEKVPPANPAQKVVETVSKSDVEASDSSNDTGVQAKDTKNGGVKKNGKKEETKDRDRKHDDTDYDSEGLDDI